MSYFTQRHANGFPLWSKVRKDPSSMGYRYLEAIGHETEIETINQIRLHSLNITGSILDIPKIYEIGGWPGLYEFENGLTAPEGMLPLFSYPEFEGDDIWPLLVEGLVGGTWKPVQRAGESTDLKGIFAFLYSSPDEAYVAFKQDENFMKDNYAELSGSDLYFEHVGNIDQFSIEEDLGVAFFNRKACIVVSETTHYQRYCMEGGPNWPFCGQQETTDINFQGEHKVVITGLLEGGNEPFSETLTILDDGYYITKNKFRTIISVVSSGFNGNIKLYPETPNIHSSKEYENFYKIVSPYHLAVHAEATNTLLADEEEANNLLLSPFSPDDGSQETPVPEAFYEAPLELTIDTVTEGELQGTYLNSWFNLYLNGQDYRRKKVIIDNEEDVKELLCSQWLIDENGQPFVTSNLIINPMDSLLYSFHIENVVGTETIDWGGETGVIEYESAKNLAINIFQLSPYKFIPWKFPRTRQIAIDIEPMTHRGSFGEQIPMWSFHKIMRSSVKLVCFKREKPSQINGEFEDECPNTTFYGDWLQADLTWGPDPYWFSGKSTDFPEDSWTDIKFNSGILDELGQWNFYCETITERNTFKELEKLEVQFMNGEITLCEYSNIKQELLKDKNNDELFRSCTAISCEYLQAKKTIKIPMNTINFSNSKDPATKFLNCDFAPFQHLNGAESGPYPEGLNINKYVFDDLFWIKSVYWERDDKLVITFSIDEEEAMAAYEAAYGDQAPVNFPSIPNFLHYNQLSDARYTIDFKQDLYLPDSINNRIWFREDYEQVRITTKGINGEEVVSVYNPDSDEDVWSGTEINLMVQVQNLEVQLQSLQGQLPVKEAELDQLLAQEEVLGAELEELQQAYELASEAYENALNEIENNFMPTSVNASLEEDVAQAAKELAESALDEAEGVVDEAEITVSNAQETADDAQEAVNDAADAVNANLEASLLIAEELGQLLLQLADEQDEAEGEIIQDLIDAKIEEKAEVDALLPGLQEDILAAEIILEEAQTALEAAQTALEAAEQVRDLAAQTLNNTLATWNDAITAKQDAFNALSLAQSNAEGLNNEKSSAEEEVDEKILEIASFQESIVTLQQEIALLEESITNLEEEISNLNEEIEEIE